jgi:hypothetical protein
MYDFLLSLQSAEIEQNSVSLCRNDAAFCSCREKNSYLYWQGDFVAQALINNDTYVTSKFTVQIFKPEVRG